MPLATYLYTVSTMHCMSVSLGLDGAGLGTCGAASSRSRCSPTRASADVLSARSSPTRSTTTTSPVNEVSHAGLRERLPQGSGDQLFVTDGGLETELVFHDGIDLPCFAAFPLLGNPDTRARLRRYYDGYLDIARKLDAGFIVETPTWRANPDWASTLGYSLEQLDAVNRSAVALAEEIRTAAAADGITVVVSGCVGPRGDGYDPGEAMTPEEAQRYHAVQIGTFASTTADQVTAVTMTNVEEAIGIVRAAVGGSHSGGDLLHRRDRRAASDRPAAARSDRAGRRGHRRRRRLLHGQLRSPDAFFAEHWNTTGHGGNGSSACARTLPRRATPSSTRPPSSTRVIRVELGAQHAALRDQLPAVRVLGGCCGTDARHVAAIASAWSTN